MTADDHYHDLIRGGANLADARLGAVALWATDEFFAPKERMLSPGEPEWRAGVYDANGKWMDGWESRRRRDAGHDYCIVQLAAPGRIELFDIDTRYFTGNYPPHASIAACRCDHRPTEDTAWTELLPRAPLRGDRHNYFEVGSREAWTHLRLDLFPDGGVARFRAYGQIERDWRALSGQVVDLAAALNGGQALACSDEHYGSMQNLLLPGRGASMADGWETRRRREPGFDWVILRLGHSGRVAYVEVDTAHFKGNFPHELSINAALVPDARNADLRSQSLYWPQLLPPQRMQADSVVKFGREQLRDLGRLSHLRINVHPDGGLSRVRIFGHPEAAEAS
jgi:allantoicase